MNANTTSPSTGLHNHIPPLELKLVAYYINLNLLSDILNVYYGAGFSVDILY